MARARAVRCDALGAPALRRLLSALGDMDVQDEPFPSSEILDADLMQGLQRFQRRHGLDDDGILGKRTFASLTTPLSQRVLQIELTLERLRWLPAVRSAPIVVNIPQFRLFALRAGAPSAAGVLQMLVIVGQIYPRTRTPVFMGEITSVIFRPYWDVPHSIVVRELVPEIRAQPDYLVRHGFEIVRGPGDDAKAVPPTKENIDALASGELRLRQQPGPDNALGLIKFMLPNAYNVYLHDTPAQRLFAESRRAFSHGCIRVGDPIALAVHVLKNTPGDWTADNVLAAMHGDTTRRVDLSSPIPVLVLYGTAVAAQADMVYFFEDIYGHDARLARLLESQRTSAFQ
jgi:murein L,D-transpeptidase YcbB/YkuD